jgi:hypothetical protein
MGRQFIAQTAGLTTRDQIDYMKTQRTLQNQIAQQGGAVTVPQFREGGLSAGPGVNTHIKSMAGSQLRMDANNQYIGCVGKPAGMCGGTRRRRKMSRKYKLKYKKKHHKV